MPELHRLYGPDRAMVLEVVLPTGWDQLSQVWNAVQSELGLPAPAIAVSGVDGLQLWFSLASPTPPSTRTRFLRGLRHRYLSNLPPEQVRLHAEAAEIPNLPPVEIGAQRWAAFITSDLVSIFAGTPWLDIPPGDEGQTTILRALAPMQSAACEAALNRLDEIEGDSLREGLGEPRTEAEASTDVVQRARALNSEPERFLMDVMNDAAAPLALRIEAAKILLAYSKRS